MMRRLGTWMMWSLLCTACATVGEPQPRIENEGQKIMIAPSFNRQVLEKGGVAILPVTSETAPEGIRKNAAYELHQALKNSFPDMPLLSDSKTLEILKQSGLDKAFLTWLKAYRSGGRVDPVLLRQIGLITERRYLLLARVDQYEKESKAVAVNKPSMPLTGPMISPSLSRPVSYDVFKDIRLSGLLWDSECRSVAWEGRGGAHVTDVSPNERIRMEDLFVIAVQNFVFALYGSAGTASGTVQGC